MGKIVSPALGLVSSLAKIAGVVLILAAVALFVFHAAKTPAWWAGAAGIVLLVVWQGLKAMLV